MDLETLVNELVSDACIAQPSQSLPEPDMVSMWKLLNDRKFYIDCDIDNNTMLYQRAIMLINDEDRHKPVEERKPIRIYIMSTGGSIDYMYMLIDTIKLSETPVYTVNIGMAASAAGLIFMSGKKRFCFPSSRVVIHEGSAELGGDSIKVIDAADTYKKDIKQMKEFIIEHTNIPKNLLSKKRPNDWTLTAKECLEYGVCDRIIESLDEVI